MIIGIDIDGVIRDIHTPTLAWWKNKTGVEKTIEDIKGWNIAMWLGADPDAHEQFYREWFSSRSIFLWSDPIPGAIEGLRKLSDKNEIFLITSQHGTTKLMTVKWVMDHIATDVYDAIVLVSDKSLIKTDVMIDDALHNLLGHPAEIKLLYDQPWNRHEDIFERVMNWEGILKRLICNQAYLDGKEA